MRSRHLAVRCCCVFLQAVREVLSLYMQFEGGGLGCGQNRLCVYRAAGFKQVVVTV